MQRHVGFKMELCGARNLYPQSHMRAWNSFGVAFAILSLILPLPPFIPWFRSCCQQTGASERVYPVILKLRLACWPSWPLMSHFLSSFSLTWMTMAGGRMSQVFLTSDSEFYLPKAIVRLFGKFANRLRRVWGNSVWMARSSQDLSYSTMLIVRRNSDSHPLKDWFPLDH